MTQPHLFLQGADAARASAAEKKKAMDYLTNLNMDPALSGYITHFLEKDSNTLGSKRGETSDICLPGKYKLIYLSLDSRWVMCKHMA